MTKLKLLMRDNKIRNVDLAKEINTSRSYVSVYVNGKKNIGIVSGMKFVKAVNSLTSKKYNLEDIIGEVINNEVN